MRLIKFSGSDIKKKYLAMNTVSKELDRLTRGIINDKIAKESSRGGGWPGQLAGFA